MFSWLHSWLKSLPKFIHLCWWFDKHGLPVPPYFVGGMAVNNSESWIIGDNDNADPDLGAFDTEETGRIDQPKSTNFALRFQISESGGGTYNQSWQLWGSATDDIGTATQIDTGATTAWAQIIDGTPTDATPTTANVISAGPGSWLDGEYCESDSTGSISLVSQYTEIMFSVQFTASAGDETPYYFWIKDGAGDMDNYNEGSSCNVTTEAATGNIYNEEVILTANATCESAAVKTSEASVILTADATQAGSAVLAAVGAVLLTAAALITPVGNLTMEEAVSLSANATATASENKTIEVATTLTADASITWVDEIAEDDLEFDIDTGGLGDYLSLNAFASGEADDLTVSQIKHKAICRASGDAADTTLFDTEGWTTDVDYDLTIEAAVGEEAGPSWDTSKYRLQPTAVLRAIFARGCDFLTLRGLQIGTSAGIQQITIDCYDVGVGAVHTIDSCFIQGIHTGDNSDSVTAVYANDAELTLNIINSVLANDTVHASSGVVRTSNSSYILNMDNCTLLALSGGGYGVLVGDSVTANIRNCYIGGATLDITGDGVKNLTTVATSDTTGSAGLQTILASTDAGEAQFVNVGIDTLDATIGTRSALLLVGTDLTADYLVDMVGTTRSDDTGTIAYDIGAIHQTLVNPIVDTDGSSGDFASLDAWQSGQTGAELNLAGNNKSHIVDCQATTSAADTAAATISGWTTTPTNDLTIRQATSDRHGGIYNDSFYRIERTGDCLSINDADINITVDGLQIRIASTLDYSQAFYVGGTTTGILNFKNCIAVGVLSGTGQDQCYGFEISYVASARASALITNYENCLAYGWDSDNDNSYGFLFNQYADEVNALNCTAYGNDRGFSASSTGNTAVVTNCIARNNPGYGFGPNWDSTSDYNTADDTSATDINLTQDSGSPWNSSATVDADIFADAASGDFRLLLDSIFDSVGVNLYSLFQTDIKDDARADAAFDLGAFIADFLAGTFIDIDTGGNGDYLSLNAWQSGEVGTLSAPMFAECRASDNSADTTEFILAGWTTTPTNKLIIRQADSDRHAGVWDPLLYRLDVATTNQAFALYDSGVTTYVDIDGLQITSTGGDNDGCLYFWDGTWISTVENCIFRGQSGGGGHYDGIQVFNSTNSVIDIYNCVFYDFNNNSADGAISVWDSSATVNAYHCTAYNCYHSYEYQAGTFNTWNCASVGHTTGFSGSVGGDYNLSDGDAPGGNSVNSSQSDEQLFVGAPNFIFNIAAQNSDLFDNGGNYSVTTDIAGTTRTQDDIGAFGFLVGFGSIVQAKTGGTDDSPDEITLTFDQTATLGNLLVVIHFTGDANSNAPSGYSEAVVMTDSGNTDEGAIYYKISDGTETLAVPGSDSTDEQMAIFYEIEGPFESSPLDQTIDAGPQDDDSAECGTTGTTSQNDEIAIAAVTIRSSSNEYDGWSDSFTNMRVALSSVAKGVYGATKLLTVTGAVSTTLTMLDTAVHMGSIATFKKEGVGGETFNEEVTLTSVALLTGMEYLEASASTTLSANATLVTLAIKTAEGSTALTADADLSASGIKAVDDSISLTADADIIPTEQADMVGEVALTADGSLAVAGEADKDESVSLSAVAQMLQEAGLDLDGEVTLSANAVLALANIVSKDVSITLTADASLSPSAILTAEALLNLAADAGVSASALVEMDVALTLAADAGLSASGALELFLTVSLDGAATIAWVDELIEAGEWFEEITLTADASLSASAIMTAFGEAILTANASLAASGLLEMYEAISLLANAQAAMAGGIVLEDEITLTAAAVLSWLDEISFEEAITLTADAGLSTSGTKVSEGIISLTSDAGITAVGALDAVGNIILSADSTLAVVGTLEMDESIILNADAVLPFLGNLETGESIILSSIASMSAEGIILITTIPKAEFIVAAVETNYIVLKPKTDYISEDN